MLLRVYVKFGRTYLFKLDHFFVPKDEKGNTKYTMDAYHAGNVSIMP